MTPMAALRQVCDALLDGDGVGDAIDAPVAFGGAEIDLYPRFRNDDRRNLADADEGSEST